MRKSSLPKLSERERQCLYWASHGKTSQEMGSILGISARTANFHLTNVCGKLGVRSRQAAVALGLRRKLFSYDRLD
ncbi:MULTISPECIES: helix-turn-helix transcriptional regulator [unclassified Castellaniella]|uniref:helix-turn-helix transcriptional regulator n=1 Tax=unclassified Castellaniella TaxID=2617606 RepID=UPI0033159CEF